MPTTTIAHACPGLPPRLTVTVNAEHGTLSLWTECHGDPMRTRYAIDHCPGCGLTGKTILAHQYCLSTHRHDLAAVR